MDDENADEPRLRDDAGATNGSPSAHGVAAARRMRRSRHVVRRGAVLAVALLLVATGVSWALAEMPQSSELDVGDDDQPAPVDDEPGPDSESPDGDEADAASDRQACRDPEGGFVVDFPLDWETAELVDGTPCRLFDPEAIDVGEHATDDVDAAITVDVLPQEFDAFVEQREAAGAPGQRRELGEHDAVRFESEATGEGLLPAGTRVVSWVVDLDGQTVVLATSEHPAPEPFEGHTRVLDDMAESLRALDHGE